MDAPVDPTKNERLAMFVVEKTSLYIFLIPRSHDGNLLLKTIPFDALALFWDGISWQKIKKKEGVKQSKKRSVQSVL